MAQTLYQAQKKDKPTVEELVASIADSGLRARVGGFVSFLVELKMKPSWYASNSFNYNYKGTRVLRLIFDRKDRHLGIDIPVEIHMYLSEGQALDKFLSRLPDDERAAFTERKFFCRACGKCAPGMSVTILGKAYDGVCRFLVKEFHNLTGAQFEEIKKLVHARMRSIFERPKEMGL